MICTLRQLNESGQVRKDEVGMTCRANEGEEDRLRILERTPDERDH
jgi:hypothetical protein